MSLWQEQLSAHSWKSRRSRSSRPKSVVGGTANFINPAEAYQLQEKSPPPPGSDLYVEFEVQDTGQGIPQELQERIFEPFVQGLGLSICHQLATLMRGSIVLTSTVGKGSTFTVKLPLRQVIATPTTNRSLEIPRRTSMVGPSALDEKIDEKASEKSIPPSDRLMSSALENKRLPLERGTRLPSVPGSPNEPEVLKDDLTSQQSMSVPDGQTIPAAPPLVAKKSRKASKEDKSSSRHDFSKLRVLVAEDNKVNQQVILRMLKMEQILQVTIAEDGQQALDRVKETQESNSTELPTYDLIFMDIQMPIMDGLTSTRLIRENGFQGPIVALTAYAEKKNVEDCYECGMNDFLAKPLRKPQLHEALTKLCASSETTASEKTVATALRESPPD
jgi:osomolarity two-component system, sensor histidine kinase SLN1